jgi:hypothetical protein
MQVNLIKYFWAFVVILASVRGVAVLHLDVPPSIVYNLSGSILLFFGIISTQTLLGKSLNNSPKLLRSAVKLNIIFLGFYMFAAMILIDVDQYSIAYSFAIFPIIFAMLEYEEGLLLKVVLIIATVTVLGVFYSYQIGISGGFEAVESFSLKLRPGELRYSRIGENLLPAGYQGNHHDASNILTMCAAFFLTKFMLDVNELKKYLYLSAYLIALFAALLSGSSANFIVLIIISCISFLFYAKKHPFEFFFIIAFSCLFVYSSFDSLGGYAYLFEKASADQSELEGGGIFNSLDLNSIFYSMHSIIFGFGYIFDVPMIRSEVAFIKQLVGYGLAPFLILMTICFSPLYYIFRAKKSIRYRLFIAAMPTFAGSLTLLHYGSLFRVTSIGLFCVLITLFFKEYYKSIGRSAPTFAHWPSDVFR